MKYFKGVLKWRLLCLIALMVTLVPYASMGRIGETKEECDARYGQVDSMRHSTASTNNRHTYPVTVFSYYVGSQIHVSVSFLSGRSVVDQITYQGRPFTEAEILYFLDINSGGGTWGIKTKSGSGWVFDNTNGARASLNHRDDIIVIKSAFIEREWPQILEERKRQKEKGAEQQRREAIRGL